MGQELASPDSDGQPNSSAPTNLTYTQLLILLGITEEERDEFIAEHYVESMTRLNGSRLKLKSIKILQLTTQAKSLEKEVKTIDEYGILEHLLTLSDSKSKCLGTIESYMHYLDAVMTWHKL
ncbi:DUF3102 domain-containing protein [Desulfosporosinus lacus]|uniref:Uncharacterized protein n=1 Tax=Desulfosporosinus lacus DSM 15449 TaxID=1121420 RepID=A0A1M6DBN0_9FIRM|nr:Protein of unknown function [Desulfosporosinus lacus DSM 15449]